MARISIVGVNHMTGGTAARSIVTRMVVGSEKPETGIQQSRLLQTEIDRIRSDLGAEATNAQPILTSLKDSEDVTGLRDLESRQRIEEWQHTMLGKFFLGGRRDGVYPRWKTFLGIGFAEVRELLRILTVAVEGRLPEHSVRGHHALADVRYFIGM